jgi:putative flavoprotein involved in K+ transport
VWTPSEERGELNLVEQGITSIIWCIGFTPDFTWVEAPVFNGRGHPGHERGVTAQAGLYFLGLPWLYTWGSGRFSGVAQDAQYVVEHIVGAVAERKVASR